jgi:hypothetical protein
MSIDNQLKTESLNSDGQQFHQCQKMNNHLSFELTEHKQRQRHMTLKSRSWLGPAQHAAVSTGKWDPNPPLLITGYPMTIHI